MAQGIQIGRLAQQTGLTIDTIRLYERKGLLKSPPRTKGGFRLYDQQAVGNLNFIRNAQRLGFSLKEIRELLILQSAETRPCSHVSDLLKHKLVLVKEKIEQLARMEQDLRRALRKCTRKMSASNYSHKGRCPVLTEIGREGPTTRGES